MKLPTAAETRNLRVRHAHSLEYLAGRIEAHVITVRRVAQVLAKRLNKRGYNLDIKAIDKAALLHDIRKEDGEHHPELAAEELRRMGYKGLANVIATHDTRTLEKKGLGKLSLEQKLLMYADARSSSGWPLTLEKRCKELQDRYPPHKKSIGDTFDKLKVFEDWLKGKGVDPDVKLTPKQEKEVKRQRARGHPGEFKEIDEHVSRSAKPSDPSHIDFLRYKGFNGVISLDPMKPELVEKARGYGIDILDMPLDEEWEPEDGEVMEAMGFIDGHKKKGGKVLIHCTGGRQRSGTMAALYRVHLGEDPMRAYWAEDRGASQRHKAYILEKGKSVAGPKG